MDQFVNYDDIDDRMYEDKIYEDKMYEDKKDINEDINKNELYVTPYKRGEITFIIRLLYFVYIINLFDKYINGLSK